MSPSKLSRCGRLAKQHVGTRGHRLLQVQDPRLLSGTQVRTRRVAQASSVHEVHASVVARHMQYFRHIYSARDNRAEDLRPYVSNLPTSIPVPRGSGDGFGIPNPRGSGSVIGADRRRSGPSCVLPKGVPQGQTESGGLVLAANAGMTTRGVVLTDLQSSI